MDTYPSCKELQASIAKCSNHRGHNLKTINKKEKNLFDFYNIKTRVSVTFIYTFSS